MTVVMNGSEVAKLLLEQTKKEVEQLKVRGLNPTLAIIRVGDRTDSIGYENAAIRVMESVGIETRKYTYSNSISETEFFSEFDKINYDEKIHGILVLRPLPDHIDSLRLSNEINYGKDIDGMSPYNIGKTLSPSKNDFIPCTPQSVLEILKYYNIDVQGKHVVIVGHSLVVGRPLSVLLLDLDATVTVCNVYTKDLKQECLRADIIVSATGKAGLIKKDFVKEGVVLIDVGTSYDSEGKVHGDLDYEEVFEKASYINPVPGGIGSITTAILANRVVIAANRDK